MKILIQTSIFILPSKEKNTNVSVADVKQIPFTTIEHSLSKISLLLEKTSISFCISADIGALLVVKDLLKTILFYQDFIV